MSLFGRFLVNAVSTSRSLVPARTFHGLSIGYNNFPAVAPNPGAWNLMNCVRTKIRNYWPRPSEVKRIRRASWMCRMSTLNGRKILMRRILKGKYFLSH